MALSDSGIRGSSLVQYQVPLQWYKDFLNCPINTMTTSKLHKPWHPFMVRSKPSGFYMFILGKMMHSLSSKGKLLFGPQTTFQKKLIFFFLLI